MRGRPLLTALLALPFAALSTPAAHAAESDITFSNVVVNNGKPVVIGTTGTVVVPITYTIKHSVKLSDHWVGVYRGPYGGAGERDLGYSGEGPYCEKNSTGTTEHCEMTTNVVAKTDLVNADATVWKTVGIAIRTDGGFDEDLTAATAHVKRNAKLTVDASPEPVTKGKEITVTGKLTRANWSTHAYGGYAGREVSLQFRKKGSSAFTTVKKITSTTGGALKATVTASADGDWRWVFYGDGSTGSRKSATDFVDVR